MFLVGDWQEIAHLLNTYPGEINLPWRDVQIHQIINHFALQKPMHIVHNDPLANVDQFDKAQVKIRDGCVEWNMIVDPALKVLHCICVFPSNVLFVKEERTKAR